MVKKSRVTQRAKLGLILLPVGILTCLGLYLLADSRDKFSTPAESANSNQQDNTIQSNASSGRLPSQILDLHNWYLTLPTGGKSADTVNQPELSSYTSEYFQGNAERNAVLFTAPVQGSTTDNSDHTRAELREVAPNGTLPWGWSTAQDSHTMTATESILHLPSKRGTVGFAQVHGPGSTWYLILLATGNSNGTATLSVKDRTGKITGSIIDSSYVLGTKFEISLSAVNGTVTIAYNGKPKVKTTNNSSGNYFKIGCYNQSPGDYGQVAVYDVSVTHSP